METLLESAYSYSWAKVPEDLPRSNLVLITAKTPASTYHPTDPKYRIRRIAPTELEAAGRSLAQRPVGESHAPQPINGAFVVDSQYNPITQSVEALVYLPTEYIMWIKSQEARGKKVEWSVEYTFRDAKFLGNGVVEFSGVVFNRVDILKDLAPNQVAGDKNTDTQLVDDYLKTNRGLMEATTLSYDGKYKDFFSKLKELVENNSDPKFIKSEILRLGIIAELDAVNLYEQLSTFTDDPAIKNVLLDIAKEEKTHAGEFQAKLVEVDPEQGNQLIEGKNEMDKLKEASSNSSDNEQAEEKKEDPKEEKKETPEEEQQEEQIEKECTWTEEENKESSMAYTNEDFETEEECTLKESKLSTEKRNALPDSVFCGPNRTFPVPDKAHVTAALRLLGRSKLSDATKQKIRACIMKKAKAFGMTEKECTDAMAKPTMKEAAELAKLTDDFNKVSAELKDLKEVKIPALEKEKNDAIAIATRLQNNAGNSDKEKAKAVKEAEERGKQKVISAIREVLPENTMVANGRSLGPYRALADSINHKLCEVSEEK